MTDDQAQALVDAIQGLTRAITAAADDQYELLTGIDQTLGDISDALDRPTVSASKAGRTH